MDRRGFVALLAGAIASTGRDLAACGDKFLIASRGTRFQRAGLVRQPAAILIYAPSGSRMAATIDGLAVAGALSKVGYRPTVVATPDAIAGAWDLVVVDLADSPAVPRVGGARPPAVIAVAFDASGATLAQARRDHAAVIRRPGRSRAVVDAVDDVLFERAIRQSGVVRTGG